ncbi:MAG: hypothetical protein PUF08_06000 [Clostridiales bacterium]|nr:hypothetical protein [Clostridiales bacterium]
MEKLFEHIAIYDFWSIFGAGAVIGTSATIVLYDNFNDFISFDKDLQLFYIFIAIIIFYIIGLILHSIASLAVELPVFSFKTSNVTVPIKNNAIRKYRWKNKYVVGNQCINQETLDKGFKNCYNYLKLNNLTKRVDKYHSIYGMARSLSVGYILISIKLLINNNFNCYNFKCLTACLILAILFFIRAKKYFYRWIELVFIQYQFEKEKEYEIK